MQALFAALPADFPVSMEVVNFEREKTMDAQAWARECMRVSRGFTP